MSVSSASGSGGALSERRAGGRCSTRIVKRKGLQYEGDASGARSETAYVLTPSIVGKTVNRSASEKRCGGVSCEWRDIVLTMSTMYLRKLGVGVSKGCVMQRGERLLSSPTSSGHDSLHPRRRHALARFVEGEYVAVADDGQAGVGLGHLPNELPVGGLA
eukprot:5845257-Pleurochrysis_carterae.AAC.1